MTATIGQVRFLIGDDDPNDQLMTDAQVQQAIDQSSGTQYAAAALAARSLSARFARQVTTASEQTRAELSNKTKAFRELADWLDQEADKQLAEAAAPAYTSFGTEDGVHDAIWDVGMHDNPRYAGEDDEGHHS